MSTRTTWRLNLHHTVEDEGLSDDRYERWKEKNILQIAKQIMPKSVEKFLREETRGKE